MENTSLSEATFFNASFYIVATIAAFFCFCAIWTSRSSPSSILRREKPKKYDGAGGAGSLSKRKKTCGCSCSCGGSGGGSDSAIAYISYANGGAGEMHERVPLLAGRQSGASMMEQLVPEITTHALSYLDFPSLCRLSMTNSSMRRAANDDSAWKALYHKLSNQTRSGMNEMG